MLKEKNPVRMLSGPNAVLIYLSMLKFAIHLLTLKNYGYLGDEFYYISASKHLSPGYVDLPTITPLIMAVSRFLFGDSQEAIHIFPAVAGALTVFFTGLLTRELGGRRFAEFLACLSVISAPVWLAIDSIFTYDSFDALFSVVFFYQAARLFNNETKRNWIALGLIAGTGIMIKLTMILLCFALFTAFLLTDRRKSLLTPWPWLSAVTSFIICVPFLIWQYLHGFPLLVYLRNYSLVMPHPMPHQFLLEQFFFLNPASFPMWAAGLYYLIFMHEEKNHFVLGLVYPVIFLVLSLVMRAEVREAISACFPILSGGAVFLERKSHNNRWSFAKPAICLLLAAFALRSAPRVLPVLSLAGMEKNYSRASVINKSVRQGSVDSFSDIPIVFSYRLGWEEMVSNISDIYRRLPVYDRENCLIYTGTFAEAGAVDLLGKSLGLPGAICNHLTYQFWVPDDITAKTVIAVGQRFDYEFLNKIFNEVSNITIINKNSHLVFFERDIPVFVCRKPKLNLRDIWPELGYFY
jgi:hypothetical protein